MLEIKDGIVMSKSQYTSASNGVTYYTAHIAAQGCADMLDVAVDMAKFTQLREMQQVNASLGYSRGRFEFLSTPPAATSAPKAA
jgi:hypothetical protein